MTTEAQSVSTQVDPKEQRVAKAPFNFVSLPREVFFTEPFDSFDRFEEGRHSGYIDLTVTCETPTYVRCGSLSSSSGDDPEMDQCSRDFFHHGDPLRPVIPGSSVKGMIRTLVEVMAFGKPQWISERKMVYREVAGNNALGRFYRDQFAQLSSQGVFDYPSKNLKAGYVKRTPQGGYLIQPAMEHYEESFIRVEYDVVRSIAEANQVCVRQVWVVPEPRQRHGGTDPGTGKTIREVNMALATRVSTKQECAEMVRGFLVVTSDLRNPARRSSTDKHMHCIVYEPDPNPRKAIPIPKDMWASFNDDERANAGDTKRRVLDPGKPEGDPVFYLVDSDGKMVFFGPTMLFRVRYPYSIKDHVPEHLRGDHGSDLGEAIFGVVSKDKTIRSRVLFGDLKWVADGRNPYWEDGADVSPKVLGSPKPTAFQEYLTQDQPDDKHKFRHWGDSPEKTVIRGHKFYWHKPWSKDKYWETEPRYDSTQHTVIRPVRPNTQFRGRVRLDNLSSLELGALLSAINLPEDMRHKIGMGKPLAMGTVRLKGTLRVVDRERRYSTLFNKEGFLETGDLPSEESDNVYRTSIDEFARIIVQHNNAIGESVDKVSKSADLWSIPRLKELGIMLAKNPIQNKDNDGYFDYPPLQNNRLDARYWRERRVIPSPRGLIRFLQRRITQGSSALAEDRKTVTNQPARGLGAATGPANPQLNRARRGQAQGLQNSHHERQVPTLGGTRTRGKLPGKPGVGDEVEGVLLEERTKKGKWRVSLAGDLIGVIVNSDSVPSAFVPGNRVRVRYRADGVPNVQMEWIEQKFLG